MKDIAFKLLVFLGVTTQLKDDLTALLKVAMTVFLETEDKMGPGNGPAKRAAAIEAFLTEVKKEGGIDLPGAFTGPMAGRLFGLLLDFLASLSKGEKPKNS